MKYITILFVDLIINFVDIVFFFIIIILIDDLRLTCKNDYNRYDYKSLGVDI